MKTYYNYILKSLTDNKLYIGVTRNLIQRLNEHAKGRVISTKNRRPFILVYYEVSYNEESAFHREKYLKSTYGHRYLKNRLGQNPIGPEINSITQC